MLRFWLRAALLTAAAAPVAHAQRDLTWEARVVGGIAMPTGAHREAFDDAALVGGQLALRFAPATDVVGLFAWQPSRSRYVADTRTADVWVYNIGLERSFHRAASGGFAPFAGAGLGGRSYEFRSSALASGTCSAGYASAGVSYERGVSTARVEARDNLFCYRPPVGPAAELTRNEVALQLAVGLRF